MSHDWIIDVLDDLRRYALKNDLPRLARQAEVTLRTARSELAEKAGPPPADDAGRDGEGGPSPR